MSIRSLLMPMITQHWLSRERLLKARAKAERERRPRGKPHVVHYFHQACDPYSALLAACLPLLLQRYQIEFVCHVVGPPTAAAAPDRQRLQGYSRQDAQRLAARHGLHFRDPGSQPAATALAHTNRALVAAAEQGHFIDAAGPLSAALWDSTSAEARNLHPAADWAEASPQQTAAHLATASALRQRLGHYSGATLFYAGEWYWGLDRLHHLEQRLQDLGAQCAGVSGALFPPAADLTTPLALADPPAIDFYFSLRSPYSAIVAGRVFELSRLSGAEVRLRYVLPMAMRGLAVPREKRLYIGLDAAREAYFRQTPFGRLNDPLGRPVERGLSLLPLAQRAGLQQAYVLSFMRGVWAEGLDAGSDRDLRRITERAGLAWADARAALQDDGWRQSAETHRVELLSLGLWGVPSFRVRDTAVWGQDRLWAVQEALYPPTPTV
jgi:2-hydroxychromene-2-carboxylate isomerase